MKNFTPDKQIISHVLNAPGINSTNEYKASTVKIKNRKQKVNLKKGVFGYQFEPHSITALEISGGKR